MFVERLKDLFLVRPDGELVSDHQRLLKGEFKKKS
jgi:hypothetical protein